jgi:hypothetical protein
MRQVFLTGLSALTVTALKAPAAEAEAIGQG